MKQLELQVVGREGSRPLEFTVERMVNAGYVGRNRKAVMAHIEELARVGVAPPPSVPMIFPVLSQNITTSDQIEVVSRKTSGEVEYVLLMDKGIMYVGVGSDHTDRDLESYSIVQSKQVCPNVLSAEVWPYEEVKGVWDRLMIESWVRDGADKEEALYQSAPLGAIISAEEMTGLISSRVAGGVTDGMVIYSGTVPVLTGEMICGTHFRCALTDPGSGRSLHCGYAVSVLDFVREPGS